MNGVFRNQSINCLISCLKFHQCLLLSPGDFFIGSAIASTLTKLALRFYEVDSNTNHQNKFTAEAMLIMASIIHLGKSGIPEKAITDDDLGKKNVRLFLLSVQAHLWMMFFLRALYFH